MVGVKTMLTSVLHVCLFSLEITCLKVDIKTTGLTLKSAVLMDSNVRITKKFAAEQFRHDC